MKHEDGCPICRGAIRQQALREQEQLTTMPTHPTPENSMKQTICKVCGKDTQGMPFHTCDRSKAGSLSSHGGQAEGAAGRSPVTPSGSCSAPPSAAGRDSSLISSPRSAPCSVQAQPLLLASRVGVIERSMNLLPYVKWDRWTGEIGSEFGICVYGWISRADGKSDFVLLRIDNEGPWMFATSSAHYSEDISKRLAMENSSGHSQCKRVRDYFKVRCMAGQKTKCVPDAQPAVAGQAESLLCKNKAEQTAARNVAS